MIRQFTLRNADGVEYTLNAVPKHGFLHSVTGLGYEDDVDYQRIGDMFRRLRDQKAQMTISGEIRFSYENGQKQFQDFVNFCQIKPLTMLYQPWNQTDIYYRDGTVTSVDYKEDNTLTVSIDFTTTTLPYKLVNVITYPDTEESEGKIYDYTYNYRYKQSLVNTVELEIDSAIDSPVKITMFGELVNPSWTHYINNVEVASGKINYTIPEGYKLVINTMTMPYTIQQVDSNGNVIADLYEASDFSTDRFIHLGHGKNRISISDDSSAKVELQAQGMIFYAAV